MSDKQIKHLIKKRAIIKGKLTGFSSYLKSLANSKQTDELQTQIELQLRLDRIESLYDDFDAFQSELDELSDMPEDEAREREAFYSQYYSLVSAGRALIQSHSKLSPPAQDTVSPVCSEVHSHRRKKTKWMQSQETLKEGALVVIKDKSSQPIMWLLGRILRVLPGEDGVARVADIRTRKGVIRRAFNMICPLPTVNIEEDSSTRGVCMSTCAPDDRVGRGRREGAGSAGDDASAAPTY
ncbi:uncharacterized protein LOC123668986 isoform X2 [Melitaea cinxia]|uniref:uncharacterized protein LOC123661244 isoform X2 n=2 Tax=Melitaea cinxia TaxID=113334 RepID=UPI001E272333|nr:uncharacterized protein LOC123661244 isoform X2 [Melitaea cinxia]XP_045458631.1 uncharacterized protein LOC123668986 isoform X2 [Melitaea cinxia]